MLSTGPPSGTPRDEVVILIGYRGCGKTSVGRRVAELLGWEFIDTDEALERETGHSIREIFETRGEVAFRKLEAELLARALAGRRRVISAGGGAVLSRRNRKALRAGGLCIWLTAPPEELHRRIVGDARSAGQRPRLTAGPALEEIETVLQARLPIYEATADHVVSTLGRSIDEIAAEVLALLGARPQEARNS